MPRHRNTKKPWDALRDAETAKLVRPSRMDALVVPGSVALANSTLTFTQGKSPKLARVPEDLLERFLALRSDQAVLAFGRKFGRLMLDATKAPDLNDRVAYAGLDSYRPWED